MKYESTVIEKWIKMINEEGINLSDWELGFMESITDQFDRSRYLSERQIEVLERIYTEKVS